MKTETEVTHTPTPDQIVEMLEAVRETKALENDEKAFIVRAVNAHDELLRIAKQMVFDWQHNEPKMPVGYINDVLQVIAKAEVH